MACTQPRRRRALPVTSRSCSSVIFLLVLSVAKPLSIQGHPEKGVEELLHAMRPATYRDANHKLEMAIIVTDFRALFGFTSIEMQQLKGEVGVFSRADGSALFEMGNTRVIAAVYGP